MVYITYANVDVFAASTASHTFKDHETVNKHIDNCSELANLNIM